VGVGDDASPLDAHDVAIGEGLRSQWLALEEYARGRKMEIKIVAATEPGLGPIAGRPQFRDAIKKAEERGWKLLVTNPSRLSRQVDHLNYVNLRKTPVWVLNEGQVPARPNPPLQCTSTSKPARRRCIRSGAITAHCFSNAASGTETSGIGR
jgi:hypothetical protein